MRITYSIHLTLAFDRYTTDSRPIFHQPSMVSVSAECWLLYRLRYVPKVGQYVNHHSIDILVDTSVDTSTDISRSLYRQRVGRYVNLHIGRHSADMSTDTSVKCRSICQSSVGQNVDQYIDQGVHKINIKPEN